MTVVDQESEKSLSKKEWISKGPLFVQALLIEMVLCQKQVILSKRPILLFR
jgi:hypothetical protein